MSGVTFLNDECPLLTCLVTAPHSHPACPVCGAVRYGNLTCLSCQRYHPRYHLERTSS